MPRHSVFKTRTFARWAGKERADIDRDELKFLQEVAKDLLGFDARQLQVAIAAGEITEVFDGNEAS